MKYTKILTIAGSDSGGGAGIQADLKTFAALECYGMSAITAVTAQNTHGVQDIHPIPLKTLEAQIRVIMEDMGADAVKIGMLHNKETVELVADMMRYYEPKHLVVDPVMVSTSGHILLEESAIDSIVDKLFPLATVITPNLPEAEVVLQRRLDTDHLLKEAEQLLQYGSQSVLLKGGHLEGRIQDTWVGKGYTPLVITHDKIATKNTHGTGCTLSSAIAALLGRGVAIDVAVEKAIEYIGLAIQQGANMHLSDGKGPVNHFFHFWKKKNIEGKK
ncbi:bifunctional hydroxymethylpyrimidine kinase/phosphomethylpyrimidine kinase [Algivirga pacifica]|uniref:hydroxymethylpyrimidine kinase n=1 Tax=Algivirga pacifica TaxID=1162670 RepID=A0ABP9DGT7_9BACT